MGTTIKFNGHNYDVRCAHGQVGYIYVSGLLIAGPFTMIARVNSNRNVTPGGICLQKKVIKQTIN